MSTVQPVKRAVRLRLWAGLLGLCYTVAVGCELPPRDVITIGALPKRPVHVRLDEDAGFDLPAGAKACKRDDDCADGIDCSVDECLPAGYCSNRLDSTLCSDGLLCNGVETCHPTQGCIKAPAPTCDDKDPCTIDHCDETAKACVHDIRDFDHDGEEDYHCGNGTDCDDFDPNRGMNAPELCGDAIDNDCDNIVDEADCGRIPHDTCDDALDVSAGGVFNVSTVGALGDYSVSCGESSATRDLVFKFALDAPHDIKLVVTGLRSDGGEEIAVIGLQTTCGDRGSELQCAHGFPGDLRVRALAAGEYYAVVSTAVGASSILLKVTFSDPTPAPTNTTCETAIDVSAGGHFDGNFVDVGDTTDTGCGFPQEPDLYYKLSLKEQSDLEVSVIGSESQPVTLALRRGCGAQAKEMRCQTDQRILAHYHQLDAGDYVLVVEGPLSREIDFGLDVAVLPATPPPVGDSCVMPEPLKLGEMQKVSLVGMQDDIESRCQGQGASDVVLSFNLDQPQDLNVMIRADDDTQVTMAIQTGCGDELTERVCRKGMPVDSVVHALPAGQYYLVIDSYSASEVELMVDVAPPTPIMAVSGNDNCYSAVQIPETGGLFSGDTSGLQQDYLVTCTKAAHFANDAAFSLTLTTGKRVVARVDTKNFDGVLMRYKSPDSGAMLCSGDAVNCNDDSEERLPILDETLPPGTYYYIVTGYSMTDAGEYTLDVSISDS